MAYTSECFPCRPGWFSSAPGSSSCQPCPSGTFSAKGASSCTPCPAHHYSRTTQRPSTCPCLLVCVCLCLCAVLKLIRSCSFPLLRRRLARVQSQAAVLAQGFLPGPHGLRRRGEGQSQHLHPVRNQSIWTHVHCVTAVTSMLRIGYTLHTLKASSPV